ncbi:MAG: D-Ala-D-Ala carboxypeptidase family metallohydrolase [Pseudomonadota bacterium]
MTRLNTPARYAGAIFFALLLTANPAHTAEKPDNPWHAITDFQDGAYQVQKGAFDGLDQLQLAAIPRGDRIHYNAPSKCLPAKLKRVLVSVAKKFGPVTVNSTYRSPAQNRKVGGRKSSWHLKCAAVDFRVHGSTRGLLAFLRDHRDVGGYKRYRSGFFHIDTGPKRTW